jgi:hypothetical protein
MNNNPEGLTYSQEESSQEGLNNLFPLADNPFKVTKVSLDTEMNYPEQEENTTREENTQQSTQSEQEQPQQVDDIEALRQQLAELESRLQEAKSSPRIEYRLPEDVLEIINKPETLAMLNEDYSKKSVGDLIKEAFKEANPWASTDRHVESHLRKQYPDIDFDMPDDLGLSAEEYDAIAWQAEGIRQQRMAQQNEIRGKIEAAKSPVSEQVDLDGYQKAFNEIVDTSIGQFKPEALPLEIPGYQYPTVDAEKIRDIVYSNEVPLSLDQEGNVWPNMKAAAAMAELEMLKSQIPAMLEAARRAAPKEAIEAMNRTLNNQVPLNNVAPIDPKQVLSSKGPSIGGLRIVGVQSNF